MMKKQKLKLEKCEMGSAEKAVGFRVRLDPGDYAELRAYAKQHSATVSDVVAGALRQCGVLTTP
jgi:NRPS condensation-like uncharacterized protein